ncbi:hypothetical protein CR513_35034, partial [Mucuna pruriens]
SIAVGAVVIAVVARQNWRSGRDRIGVAVQFDVVVVIVYQKEKTVQNLLIMAYGSLSSNNQQKKPSLPLLLVAVVHLYNQWDLQMQCSSSLIKTLTLHGSEITLKDKNNRKSVMCDFCLKTSRGGITRVKRHQLGIRGDVDACRKISEDIRLDLKAVFEQKKAENEIYMEGVQEEGDEEDEVEEIVSHKSGKKACNIINRSHFSFCREKNVNVKDPLHLHFFKRPALLQKT